jgi:hypothetical protein
VLVRLYTHTSIIEEVEVDKTGLFKVIVTGSQKWD